MKRFPFYLGVTLVAFSVSFLFLSLVQGPAIETIRANPVALATFLTVAGLFSGGFGLILVANISGKGVGTNTPRIWLIVSIITAVGVILSLLIISFSYPFVGTGSTASAQVSAGKHGFPRGSRTPGTCRASSSRRPRWPLCLSGDAGTRGSTRCCP